LETLEVGQMGRALLLTLILVIPTACGATEEAQTGGVSGSGGTAGTGGTAGVGGAPPPPPSVDKSCREWCSNEPEGFSCHQGPPESVQDCYESCLAQYQSAELRECGEEWIAIRDCELAQECEDLFGDCDSKEDDLDECYRLSNNREYCEANCPQLDVGQCEQDTTECRALVQAASYCQTNCSTQDLEECIQEHVETGTCTYQEATNACKTYCARQDLQECVDEWLATEGCEYDGGAAACGVLCPTYEPQSYCAEYWEQNGDCPDGPPPEPVRCGEGESIGAGFVTDVGAVNCDVLGVLTIAIEVVLAAKSLGPIGGDTDFEVQAQQVLDEETVGVLAPLINQAMLGASWTNVDETGGTDPANVAAMVPCEVDFTDDPDSNGTPGPVVITTPVATATWTAIDGSVVIEAVDIEFAMTQPVPLVLATGGSDPSCTWITRPRVVFDAAP
jgi:hypothetical protein